MSLGFLIIGKQKLKNMSLFGRLRYLIERES